MCIRDSTKAVIAGKNRKINFAYNSGGASLLAETVGTQLGIPVDFTVTVDLDGFIALVDAIGGVDFYIPVNMDYDDPLQGLSIHYQKGQRHLNGRQAMEVVRFRHNTCLLYTSGGQHTGIPQIAAGISAAVAV